MAPPPWRPSSQQVSRLRTAGSVLQADVSADAVRETGARARFAAVGANATTAPAVTTTGAGATTHAGATSAGAAATTAAPATTHPATVSETTTAAQKPNTARDGRAALDAVQAASAGGDVHIARKLWVKGVVSGDVLVNNFTVRANLDVDNVLTVRHAE